MSIKNAARQSMPLQVPSRPRKEPCVHPPYDQGTLCVYTPFLRQSIIMLLRLLVVLSQNVKPAELESQR
jgi:hypothetical protein